MKLDLDSNRIAVAPREAATLILVRDRLVDGVSTLEVFCVVRHAKSGFLGGAVVFPGGKVDDTDRDPAWAASTTEAPRFTADDDAAIARAYAVAVCREALEEAAILLTTGAPLAHTDAIALRSLVAQGTPFRDAIAARALTLDLVALQPFGRWVTPVAESRRFDTRFFLACAPAGQEGAHDAHETTASFWASPREVLRRFDAGELQLAPPTHRSLELLTGAASTREAFALAKRLGVEPICPQLVPLPPVEGEGEATMALVLPGDPEHEVHVERVPGLSRFVLRDGRWVPERVVG
jgi:8-oxo-dGTP pyrophosphatase MutT (NUDIX family)